MKLSATIKAFMLTNQDVYCVPAVTAPVLEVVIALSGY